MTEALFEKVSTRRKQQLERKQKEEKQFLEEIKKGKYPAKCFECFQMGIRNCKWWKQNFECENYEKEKAIQKIKTL